jgi:hypothetical protein
MESDTTRGRGQLGVLPVTHASLPRDRRTAAWSRSRRGPAQKRPGEQQGGRRENKGASCRRAQRPSCNTGLDAVRQPCRTQAQDSSAVAAARTTVAVWSSLGRRSRMYKVGVKCFLNTKARPPRTGGLQVELGQMPVGRHSRVARRTPARRQRLLGRWTARRGTYRYEDGRPHRASQHRARRDVCAIPERTGRAHEKSAPSWGPTQYCPAKSVRSIAYLHAPATQRLRRQSCALRFVI